MDSDFDENSETQEQETSPFNSSLNNEEPEAEDYEKNENNDDQSEPLPPVSPMSGSNTIKYTMFSPPKNVNKMVEKYYSLKSKYEAGKTKMINKLLGSKMTQKEIKKRYNASYPKCVNCKRSVGMLFNSSDNTLSVQCGAVQGIFKKKDGTTIQPCDVDFSVELPHYNSIRTLMKDYEELLNQLKNQLKLLKLQHLYGHIDDDQSIDKYQKIMEEYEANSEAYSTLKQLHMDKLSSVNDEIQLLKTELSQYHASIKDALIEARTDDVENKKAYRKTAFEFYEEYHKVSLMLREKEEYKTFFDSDGFIDSHTHLNKNSIYEDEIYFI